MTILPRLLLLGAALFCVGCDSSTIASLDLLEGDADPAPLPGTAWTLTTFVENGEAAGVGTTEITLFFADEDNANRIEGSSSVRGTKMNGYSGFFRVVGSDQSARGLELAGPPHGFDTAEPIPGVLSTRAGEPEGSRYDDYLLLLREVDGYRSDGETLVLTVEGEAVLAFEAR